LAVGEDRTGVVSPLDVVEYGGVAAAAHLIAETAARMGAATVVLGLPTLADGSTGPASKRSLQLAEELRKLDVAVALQGEFLTTDEARRRARAAGRPADQPVDDLAAQVLLEEFLNAHSSTPATGV
jgi:RNase H-fold protein (predicted Holliday junction resolvase)